MNHDDRGDPARAGRDIAANLAAGMVGNAPAASAGEMTVVIDIHGNTVMSERDIKRLAATIGRRLSRAIFPKPEDDDGCAGALVRAPRPPKPLPPALAAR